MFLTAAFLNTAIELFFYLSSSITVCNDVSYRLFSSSFVCYLFCALATASHAAASGYARDGTRYAPRDDTTGWARSAAKRYATWYATTWWYDATTTDARYVM